MTADSFLAHIRAHPDDDTARLVYADWLEESGEAERAEFIRVQVELERLPAGDARCPQLRRREAELFLDRADEWAYRELPDGLRISTADADRTGRPNAFRRGLVDHVSADLAGFLADGGALARLPLARVALTNLDGRVPSPPAAGTVANCERLAACPALEHVSRLDLKYNRLGTGGLAAILGSPHLGPLRELSLGPDQCGTAGGEIVAACERLGELRKLDLGSCRIDDSGLFAVLASPFLRNVADVDLSGCNLTDVAALRLAGHEPMRGWKALDLSYNGLDDGGVRALLASRHASNLEELDLSSLIPRPRVWLADALVRALIEVGLPPAVRALGLHASHFSPAATANLINSGRLQRLTELNLGLNPVTGPAAQAFGRSPHVARLETLRLYFGEMDDADAQALAASRHLRPTHLSISTNRIGPRGMQALAESEVLSRVASLSLEENPIADDGVRAIAGAPWLSQLTRLVLSACHINEAGAEALAASPGLAGIVSLDLRSNRIGDRGVIALAGSPHVARLRQLDLRNTKFGPPAADALARSPHLNNLRALRLSNRRKNDPAVRPLSERFGPVVVFV